MVKTDGRAEAVRGEELTYVITVTNAGPDNVVSATVQDTLSPDLTNARWTCDPVPPIPGDLTLLELTGQAGARAVTVSPDGAHVYVAASSGSMSGRLVAFQRDRDSASTLYGRLGFLQGIDRDGTSLLGGATAVAISPDGEHLYVAAPGDNAVAIFDRDALSASSGFGTLTAAGSAQDGVGDADGLAGAASVAVSPDGQHVYVAARNEDAVGVFSRSSTTGALTFAEAERDGVDDPDDPGGTVDGLDGASGVAVSPDGKHVYVTGETDDAIAVFSATRPPAS